MVVKVGLKFIDKWKESMENKILEYEKEEIIKGQIVFLRTVEFHPLGSLPQKHTSQREALLGASGKQCCINRGFGSSTTEHHLYYLFLMMTTFILITPDTLFTQSCLRKLLKKN